MQLDQKFKPLNKQNKKKNKKIYIKRDKIPLRYLACTLD